MHLQRVVVCASLIATSIHHPYLIHYRLRRPVIHLCSKFFTEDVPYEGQNSKAGILIQQATQFRLNRKAKPVRMVARGPTESYYLSQHWPHFAAVNADNYEYFAENVASPSITFDKTNRLKLDREFASKFQFAFG